MSEKYEPFCSNPKCKFHKFNIPVGSRYMRYIDPSQYENVTMNSYRPASVEVEVCEIERVLFRDKDRVNYSLCRNCANEIERKRLMLVMQADNKAP